jgi:hypothetical protein
VSVFPRFFHACCQDELAVVAIDQAGFRKDNGTSRQRGPDFISTNFSLTGPCCIFGRKATLIEPLQSNTTCRIHSVAVLAP